MMRNCPTFLVLSLLSVVSASEIPAHHVNPPNQRDVTSPFACVPDSLGFFGEFTSDVETIEYYFELVSKEGITEDESDDMILALETAIAKHILSTDTFKDACDQLNGGSNRLLGGVEVRHNGQQRGLQPGVVGMTINPPDEPLGLPCSDQSPGEGMVCDVYDGALYVYVTQDVPQLQEDVLLLIESAMNAGDFDNAHKFIDTVSFVSDIDSYTSGPIEGNDEDLIGNGGTGTNNRAVFISAGVGSAFVLAGLVFYRRVQAKKSASEDDNEASGIQTSSV